MYYCIECKEVFDLPNKVDGDASEYFGRPVIEPNWVCPVCGSDEYVELSEIVSKIENVMEDYNLDLDMLMEIMEV